MVLGTSIELFARKRFRLHRLWGLFYLAQFAAAVALETRGEPSRVLFCTLPATGLVQSIIACLTFTFLPRADEATQGYYHKTKAMSFDFILENVYFAALLLFQSLYVCYPEIWGAAALLPIELLWVFFPYYTVRNLFPKSSFRNSTRQGNRYALIVKVFYCTAKHLSGYYVNYLVFLGRLGSDPLMEYASLRRLLLLGGWGTTIAMFLQTLKFRKHISPRVAGLLYAGSFPLFYSCYVALLVGMLGHAWVAGVAIAGLVINFGPRRAQIVWQCIACTAFLCYRS